MPPVLFIADLHLDPGRPAVTEHFFRFLQDEAARASSLYILGDLFEFWIGDDDQQPHNNAVVKALRQLADSGTAVYFMHGNRDFLIGDGFARHSGCTLLPDPTLIELAGRKALLMHGDLLCTDDRDYQVFRQMVRSSEWQQAMLSRPITARIAEFRRLRQDSQDTIRKKPELLLDVNAQSVEAMMRKYDVNLLIHGHTHRPAIHDMTLDGKPAQRIVLGDWYEQDSVLVFDDNGLSLQARPFQ